MAKKILLHTLEIYLLADKAVFIPKYEMLVISDWHLGKLGHFRKEGLFVPPMQLDQEFARLALLINETKCKRLVFLGDLFHSEYNYEWDILVTFLRSYPTLSFELTTGNHDILSEIHIAHSPIKQRKMIVLDEGVVLSHEPIRFLENHIYNIVGHIHPGCEIKTLGRQRFKMPCFVLEGRTLILPAFGQWTGLYLIPKTDTNRLFALLNNDVVEVIK